MLLSCFFSPLQQDPDFSLPHLLFGNPVFFLSPLLSCSAPACRFSIFFEKPGVLIESPFGGVVN
jgi:hypothetical protein